MLLIGTGAIFSSCPHFYPSLSWSGFIVRESDLFERQPPPTVSLYLYSLLWPSSTHSFYASVGSEVLNSSDCKRRQQGPQPWEKCPCSEPCDRQRVRERVRPRGSCPWWRMNSRLFRLQKNGPITPAWKLRQGQEWNDKGLKTLHDFCTIFFFPIYSLDESKLADKKKKISASLQIWVDRFHRKSCNVRWAQSPIYSCRLWSN